MILLQEIPSADGLGRGIKRLSSNTENPGHEKLGYTNTQTHGGTGVGHSTDVGSTRPSHSWRYARQAKPELTPTIYQTLKTAHKAKQSKQETLAL